MVRSIGHTVLFLDPWDAPAPLLRAWCLWEIYHTVDGGAALVVVMSAEQQARFAEALMNDFDSIMMALSKVDVNQAETLPLVEGALAGIRLARGEEHPHVHKFAKGLEELRRRRAA